MTIFCACMQFGGFLSCKVNSLAEFGDCREGGWTNWEEGKGALGPTGSSFKATGHTGLKGQKKKETKKAKPSYISRSMSF